MNANDLTRVRRLSGDGGAAEPRPQLPSAELRHPAATWLVQQPAHAYRRGKTRSDERSRTVDAVGDKHGPQADRKCDTPNHLDLAWARANSMTHVVGALSAARARGRLRSPIHRAPASQQMLTQRNAARTMAASDKSRSVTGRRGRSQRAPRNASCALIRRRLGTRQCVIRTSMPLRIEASVGFRAKSNVTMTRPNGPLLAN